MTTHDAPEALIGKMVRTEDRTRFNCGEPKHPESEDHRRFHNDGMCGPNDAFGGEGLVVEVYDEGDMTWLAFDYGYAFAVGPTTEITVRPPQRRREQ